MSTNIDARGMNCPLPVIATKKALDDITSGIVTILVDNLVAKENVTKFATAQGCDVSITEENKNFLLEITKAISMPAPAAMLQAVASGNTVYVFTQDTLGQGHPELGAVLMKGFIYGLLETQPLPKTLLFMNSGILLTIKDSPVLPHLVLLVQNGVEILSCGTCLDYFAVKDKLAVGGVTNMYTIVEAMSAAAKVITL